ncbi:MAG TPA: hypothetical protein VIN08_07760 [Ohtaekwangia sp.]|uniref:hypothetical protein n=1 Tax=Ohtaekwangia sp. TaxID=2066019 RepID=UPI002F94FC7C
MNVNFIFDHRYLSVVDLHLEGIRSTKLLEESLFDPYSKLRDVTQEGDIFPVFVSFGFSESMIPIKYTFELCDEILVSRQAKIFNRQEIKRYYCGG